MKDENKTLRFHSRLDSNTKILMTALVELEGTNESKVFRASIMHYALKHFTMGQIEEMFQRHKREKQTANPAERLTVPKS